MFRYVPGFILDRSASPEDSGSFTGFMLFVDIAGFTELSNVFKREGKKGAEALNQFLIQALSYPIQLVEKHGGFISHFAGDAVYAAFPKAKAEQIKYLIDELIAYYDEHQTYHTDIGDYPLKVRIAVSKGKINWRLYRLPLQSEYVFSGDPLQEIIKLSDAKLELALSPSVQAAFDGLASDKPAAKQLEYKLDEALEKQFLNPKLHDINPDNEIRDAVYCFIDMSELKQDRVLPVLTLMQDKLDDYGGYLNKLDAGDKGLVALLLFGLPWAMGNTLERACRFALETIALVPQLAIGLSCGNAYAGFVGSESTKEFTALGSAVNLAARLMQKAKQGEIFTDGYLKQEMRHKYHFEPAATLTLKGFDAALQCHRLIERLPAPPQSFMAELVGREAELKQIRQAVEQAGSRIVYVSGEAGLGKSRLILEALKPYPKRYFLFCDPSGHKSLEPIKQFLRQYFAYDPLLSKEQNQKSFRAAWSNLAGEDRELKRIESIVADLLGFDWAGSIWSMLPPEEKPDQQKRAFATLLRRITASQGVIIHLDDPQWLDNTDADYFRELGTIGLEGMVIIAACRYMKDGSVVNLGIPNWEARHLELKRLDEAAAATLITYLLKLKTLPPETRDWIVKKADGNPLFIEQVVAYLKENDCFDPEYQLKGELDSLNAFGIADIVGSRIDSLTEMVRNTLQHACVLGLEFNTRVLSEMLSCKLDDELGGGKKARVWAEVDELRYIFSHVLIKDTAYNRMLSEKLQQLHLLAAETFERLYQDDEQAQNEHAEEMATHFENAKEAEKAAKYYDKAGCWYRTKYDWERSETFLKAALAIREKVLGGEHLDTAISLNNLADLYQNQGKYAAAEPLLTRALAINEKLLGGEHPDTAISLNNLASLFNSQGRYEEAEPLHLRALAIREKVLGGEHPDTAGSLNNLANLYSNQGRYKEAEPLHLRALEIAEKVFGSEHPHTAKSLNNLALLYKDQGRYEEVEPLHLRSLAIHEKVLGEEHPHTAVVLGNLAGLYWVQNKYEESEPLFLRALAIRKKVLGEEHPDTAQSLNNLALLYDKQGRYGEAEPLLIRALAIREKVLGEEHPETSLSLNNLAALYYKQGRYEGAEPLFLRVLAIYEKVLGEEHPSTALSLNNLAALYYKQGRYEEAEPLHLRALAIREKLLGGEHPSTALSVNNLAVFYKTQSRYEDAEPLFLRSLKIREKALGTEHPDTQKTIQSLIDVYEKLNQADKANEYQAMLITKQ